MVFRQNNLTMAILKMAMMAAITTTMMMTTSMMRMRRRTRSRREEEEAHCDSDLLLFRSLEHRRPAADSDGEGKGQDMDAWAQSLLGPHLLIQEHA